jgi:hypothetical protein
LSFPPKNEGESNLRLGEDRREKIQALSLAKECYSMKQDLLTNATVVDDAITFVSQKSKEKLKSSSISSNEDEKEESKEHDYDKDQLEEKQEEEELPAGRYHRSDIL